jgi:hypothetical protein
MGLKFYKCCARAVNLCTYWKGASKLFQNGVNTFGGSEISQHIRFVFAVGSLIKSRQLKYATTDSDPKN